MYVFKVFIQKGQWALDRSPESLSGGEDVNHKNIIPILKHFSLYWVSLRS